MIYELPEIHHVIENSPIFRYSVHNTQHDSEKLHKIIKETLLEIRKSTETGRALRTHNLRVAESLETASYLITDHSDSLQKFSSGMTRIETYREMLLTQTDILTLGPLQKMLEDLTQLKECSEAVAKSEVQYFQQLERYCSNKQTTSDEGASTYPKLCLEALQLKHDLTQQKAEYVNKLRTSTRNIHVMFVSKMLEQMLAQFSYVNFAYQVMSEMEPFLSEWFSELQTLQKNYKEVNSEDNSELSRLQEEISESFEVQVAVMKEVYSDAVEESKGSGLKSLFSLVPSSKSLSANSSSKYISKQRDSFLSYLSSDISGEDKCEDSERSEKSESSDMMTTIKSKIRYNPFSKSSDNKPISNDYDTVESPIKARKDVVDENSDATETETSLRDNNAFEFDAGNESDNTNKDVEHVKRDSVKRDDNIQDDSEDVFNLSQSDHLPESIRSSQSTGDLTNISLLIPEVRRSVSDVDISNNDPIPSPPSDTTKHRKVQRHRSQTDGSLNKKRSRLIKQDSVEKLRNKGKTHGYMYVKQKSALGYKWILMYCTIEQDWLKGVLNDSDKVIELEHLPTTTVKNVGPEVDRNSCFYMISPKGTRCYQALTELDRRNWMKSLSESVVNALQRKNSSATDFLARVRAVPGNSRCADCDNTNPEWACIDHGTCICIECSGVHRSFGVTVSKVRSLLLDFWSDEMLKDMERKGNSIFNKTYEENLDSSDRITSLSSREQRESFIRKKYIKKLYVDQTKEEGSSNQT